MTEPEPLVGALRDRIRRTVGPLLEGSRRVALLDFPTYGNVGDNAVWLGGLALLRDMGIDGPAYASASDTFDPDVLRRRVGDGPILLTGGGNLGDLYPRHQRFREEVVRTFPENPIIQLSQSMWFGSRDALDRARSVFDAHPRLTILARDRASLRRVRRAFSVRSLLCPDMALALGPLRRAYEPARDLIWLLRTGPEAANDGVRPPDGACVTDWVRDEPSLLLRTHTWLRSRSIAPERAGLRALRLALRLTYEPVARQRLERGIRLLSSARRVVTDRLHGHILCLLLGIPHTLMDNANGKVGAFYRTWTSDCGLVGWLDEPGRVPRSTCEARRARTGER